MSIHEAIAASAAADKEEAELEHLVEVLGDGKAQEAAERHSLPEFVYGMNDGEASR